MECLLINWFVKYGDYNATQTFWLSSRWVLGLGLRFGPRPKPQKNQFGFGFRI